MRQRASGRSILLYLEKCNIAGKSFAILEFNPRHPSLRMKKIGSLWSVRIGDRYRALGVDVDGGILWIWIGTHAEYDKLVT